MTSTPFEQLSRSRLIRPIEAIAFWTAVVLPFLYIPLLIVGLESTAELATFLVLVGLNIVAFVIGHPHNSS